MQTITQFSWEFWSGHPLTLFALNAHNVAYRENPIREILRAVRGLPKDDYFAECYAMFVRDMVYGEAPDFKTALATISDLAEALAA